MEARKMKKREFVSKWNEKRERYTRG